MSAALLLPLLPGVGRGEGKATQTQPSPSLHPFTSTSAHPASLTPTLSRKERE